MSDHHKFNTHLPKNKKEFAIFMLVVSAISVNIIAPLITFSEIGFSRESYFSALKILPFIWICVIPVVLLTEKPARKLMKFFAKTGDSFSATITLNVLCNVFLMSIILTIVGAWIGNWQISWTPILEFFAKWPRNFDIAFSVELLIAQPIARQIMAKIHAGNAQKSEK